MVEAPGSPGIWPRWTSSAKSGIGTALSDTSRVWFTISHGILNEVYYPRVDQACIRDPAGFPRGLSRPVRRCQAYGNTPRLHAHEAVAEAATLGGDPIEDGGVLVSETVGQTLGRSRHDDWRMRNRCDKHRESDIVLTDRELHRDLPHRILNSRGRRAVPLSSGLGRAATHAWKKIWQARLAAERPR